MGPIIIPFNILPKIKNCPFGLYLMEATLPSWLSESSQCGFLWPTVEINSSSKSTPTESNKSIPQKITLKEIDKIEGVSGRKNSQYQNHMLNIASVCCREKKCVVKSQKTQIEVNTLYLKSPELCNLYVGFIREKQSSYVCKEKHC